MKNIILILSIGLLILTGCTSNSPAVVESSSQTRTISINGTGTIELIPDIAQISIGVSSQGSEAEQTVAENTAQTQLVLDSLKSLGIDPKDITTSNFSIYPQQNYDQNGKPTDITYQVQNSVHVTVRDLASLGKILDEAVKAGANNVGNIQFDISDRESANQQALDAAMKNAEARAKGLAQSAGVELGVVQSIVTNINQGGSTVYATRSEAMTSSSVPISTGTLEVSVDVSVVYLIK